MAAGKTRAAHAAAERLGLGVIDTDSCSSAGSPGSPSRRSSSRRVRPCSPSPRRAAGRPARRARRAGSAEPRPWSRSGAGRSRVPGPSGRSPTTCRPAGCAVDHEEMPGWPPARPPLAADRAEFPERHAPTLGFDHESPARAILPERRTRLGPGCPRWAMQGTPAVRMAWAESESGSYPCCGRRGRAIGCWTMREEFPDLPARTASRTTRPCHHRACPAHRGTIGVRGGGVLQDDLRRERSSASLLGGSQPRRPRAGLGAGWWRSRRLLRGHLPAA
jgi:hypothetical protein